jgi:hypothetical protein
MFTRPNLSRRDALRVGCLSALGLALPDLRLRAAAPKAKSCIHVWLDGGPSHLETFDLKPDAPSEVRGPFQPIKTNVTGLSLCEFLPNTARVADKLAVVRSVTSPLGEHGIANHYLLTGYKPSPVIDYPSYGAVTAHVRGGKQTLPSYVAIPETKPTAGAGFLGAASRPFATGGDPAKPDFAVRDLDFFPGVTDVRMSRRREFLDQLDRFHKKAEADPTLEQAYRLTTTPAAKKAFDLTDEKPAVRGRYGPRTIGQSCLLARRLVERGVPFVTVHNTGWDTHDGLVLRLKEGYAGAKVGVGLVPTFDIAFAALVGDLSDRGMLDETLVIAMGEFGRTPKLNAAGGRDHWPRVFSVAFAGGGVKGGQVIGSTDPIGLRAAEGKAHVNDVHATILHLLGFNHRRLTFRHNGRNERLTDNGGEVIEQAIA